MEHPWGNFYLIIKFIEQQNSFLPFISLTRMVYSGSLDIVLIIWMEFILQIFYIYSTSSLFMPQSSLLRNSTQPTTCSYESSSAYRLTSYCSISLSLTRHVYFSSSVKTLRDKIKKTWSSSVTSTTTFGFACWLLLSPFHDSTKSILFTRTLCKWMILYMMKRERSAMKMWN